MHIIHIIFTKEYLNFLKTGENPRKIKDGIVSQITYIYEEKARMKSVPDVFNGKS